MVKEFSLEVLLASGFEKICDEPPILIRRSQDMDEIWEGVIQPYKGVVYVQAYMGKKEYTNKVLEAMQEGRYEHNQ